ncbi:MAG: DNA polymerase III subunit chi [Pseudomonadota bacterium]
MGEVRFYHLTEKPVEAVLPVMLARCLDRNWRVVVRGTEETRLEALCGHFWASSGDRFLPHGTVADGRAERQPIWLTAGPEVPNAASVLFLIDRAEAAEAEFAAMDMTALLFDGHDSRAVDEARDTWRIVAAAGLSAVYWAQDAGGSWVKKAESGDDNGA